MCLGPFKAKLWVAQKDWMTANPGRTITINNLVSLTNMAYKASSTIKNIVAALCKPGIWQFSRLVFNDEDFQLSYVTDRELSSLEPSPSADRPTTPNKLKLWNQQGISDSRSSSLP
jgi:hypothetical protein